MQLDQTHVVIRLRTLAEIGDLALVMIRRYPAAILVGFSIGAFPWIVANAVLLSWIPIREASYGLQDEEAQVQIWRYLYWMVVMVFLQTPAAGVFTTYYLGQAVFEHQPTWSSVFREVSRQALRWLYVLGLKRMAIIAVVFLAFRIGTEADPLSDFFVPAGFLTFASLVRGLRPFLPEILLLENCPLRSKSDSVIDAARRSKSLHSIMSSDLFGRFVAVGFIVVFLFLSVMYSLIWTRGISLGNWDWDLFTLLVFFPMALWIVAAFSVFVRLLGYLDTRIRLEGWEVDLAVRAERIRQFGDGDGADASVGRKSAAAGGL